MANTASGATLAATPGIKEFYALAAGAEVYIGGDTGPTHIAAAAGAPIVGIFGPTEWWRNGSLNPLDICVGREDISCRIDCHRRTCSKWICMDISVEQVFDAVRKRVGAD
jgi:ADP-heptose:LPS heptosyltransferase